ncbi:MAG TPA: ATP-binding cassette domain-containing protein [Methylomirabilota bacterium]|nr:ATP-binding cassette domain-containing protein [Methylomirabilota bacterium]
MIVLRDVSKRFGIHQALDGVSLAVEPHTTHVLLGGSGSGKSTVLRLVLGLVAADAGEVSVDGVPVGPATRSDIQRRIGYVVQEGALYPHLTVAGNAGLPARARGWAAAAIEARLDELARIVDIRRPLLQRYPAELSGGQRQRVGLMRALVLDPPILLLDEPLGALDPIIRTELQGELLRMFQKLRKTVVLVTHDVREAFMLGTTITLLDAGRVVQHGTFADLAQRPATPLVTEFLRAQAPPPEMTEYL